MAQVSLWLQGPIEKTLMGSEQQMHSGMSSSSSSICLGGGGVCLVLTDFFIGVFIVFFVEEIVIGLDK